MLTGCSPWNDAGGVTSTATTCSAPAASVTVSGDRSTVQPGGSGKLAGLLRSRSSRSLALLEIYAVNGPTGHAARAGIVYVSNAKE